MEKQRWKEELNVFNFDYLRREAQRRRKKITRNWGRAFYMDGIFAIFETSFCVSLVRDYLVPTPRDNFIPLYRDRNSTGIDYPGCWNGNQTKEKTGLGALSPILGT